MYQAATNVDAKTMSIQYLEALKALGASPSTKFVLPLELTGVLSGLAGYTSQAFNGDRTTGNGSTS